MLGFALTRFGKPVAMRVARAARKRLARPITEFCSWMMVGTPRICAANKGGRLGYPPKPTTARGFIARMRRSDAPKPEPSFHADRKIAIGFLLPKVAESTE